MFKKAQKGNREAFVQLLQPEKEKLYKMAYIYMKNEDDALDVVQESITKAFASIHKVKNERYFSTWLVRIVINTALEHLRKNSKIILMQPEVEEQAQSPLFDERIDLLHAIEQLEEKYKTVILLKYYQDLSIKEIAEILDCPEGTVKTNVHRGLQQLKKALNKGGAFYGEQY